MRRLLPLLLLAPLALPAAAEASTVVTYGGAVAYTAGPGEVNAVRFAAAADGVTVSDPGATITPGEGCTTTDAHTAVCGRQYGFGTMIATLGDGDDTAELILGPTNGRVAMVADGGPGNDVLTGAAGDDRLDGGGGRDVLRAAGGYDELTDGDTDATADADVLDVGTTNGLADVVSYARRDADLTVDLAAGTGPDGDVLTGVASVTGGDGDDRLTGTDAPGTLDGGAGDDVLVGGDEGGTLIGGRGADRLTGGDEDDGLHPGSGRDRVGCGGGSDTVFGPQAKEVLSSACESVYKTDGDEDFYRADTMPERVRGGIARWGVACPENVDEEPQACRGSFTVREVGGDERLLAKATITGVADRLKPVATVRLTALGRSLAARRKGVSATARLRGKTVPSVTWSLRLRD